MNQNQTDQEIDAFFDWLIPQLPKNRPLQVPTPTPEMLDLAWQATQAHQAYYAKRAQQSTESVPNTPVVTAPTGQPSKIEHVFKTATKQLEAFLNLLVLEQEALQPAWQASDGSDVPFPLDSIGGKWSVTWDLIPGDDSQQILKWRCRDEYKDDYEGQQVVAEIAGQAFDLGEIFDGIAETMIPRSLDLKREAVTIHIGTENQTTEGDPDD